MKRNVLLLLPAALCASVAFARVEPSALFTDHAVLLRAADTPVFGFAAPGEKVTVTLGATSASAVADAKGAWLVRLDLREAPKTPQTLMMNEARAEDVLVGAVWLCSGQSNMSFTLASADDAEAENRLSNAEIRCFHVDTRYELKPNPRIAGRWLRDRPQEKLGFSAIGYHFAKRLQAELGAPVGIVNSSVGASTIEAWCDAAAMAAFPEGKRRLDGQIAFMANYRDYERTCQAALRAWETKWNRADRPHGRAPQDGWRALTPAERDSFRHGPGAIWLRRVVKPAPAGLVVRRKRFVERQWRFDTSSIEVSFNGRRLGLSYPASPIEKNTELYAVPAAEAAKGGELTVRVFNALDIPDVLHYLSADGSLLAPAGWELAEEFDLPRASADAVKDVPAPQRFCLSQHYPGALYNGMVAGLVPMGLSGVVWYQGESNATHVEAGSGPEAYAALFEGFIRSWRTIFGKPALPFAWCQLASLGAKAADANEGTTDAWVALRAAQQRTLALPQTGQVILVDAGEQGDIHPRDKRTPGCRLADWALNRVYGRTEVPCRGPCQAGVAFADGKATVRFAGCAGGLVARDLGETYVIRSKSNTRGKVKRNSPAAEVEGFALAGRDGVWRWADAATIRGETVEVSAKAVPQSVAVRYGWSKNPWVNLYNGANLPAEPFEVSATDGHDVRR